MSEVNSNARRSTMGTQLPLILTKRSTRLEQLEHLPLLLSTNLSKLLYILIDYE